MDINIWRRDGYCLHDVDCHDRTCVTCRRSRYFFFNKLHIPFDDYCDLSDIYVKLVKKINCVSVFQNHVILRMVRMRLRNRSTKRPWKRNNNNKNTQISELLMEHIVWHWQSVRNWYDLSKSSFRSHNFHRDTRQNLWSHGLFDSKQNGAASNNRRWWYDIFEFMERNTIAREVQTVGLGRNVIYLAYAW